MKGHMQAAYDEAKAGYDEGGLPVGSVIVKDGMVLGAGHNRFAQTRDPTTHAEMEAVRDVAAQQSSPEDVMAALKGATCYTTMMPCEMCTGALIKFGIEHVVVGETQSYVPAQTRTVLEGSGITVEVVRDETCTALSERYQREQQAG